jgi:hypothetical protein
MPNVGDLIATTGYKNGYVYFSTPVEFKNGNASIAVRNSKDLILWSWHIWCTEEGWNDQVYPNNAGTMMDRNLGATSATPGDIGAFGLLYQWGRKDPFMGSCVLLGDNTFAASTGNWSNIRGTQTLEYAEENPMTYFYTTNLDDWCSNAGAFEMRWFEYYKTMRDPCPVGYRIPKGGENGFWAIAYKSASNDVIHGGCLWELANGTYAWYPSAGQRTTYNNGELVGVGKSGYYWSATPSYSSTHDIKTLYFNYDSTSYSPSFRINTEDKQYSGRGCSVRCVRE